MRDAQFQLYQQLVFIQYYRLFLFSRFLWLRRQALADAQNQGEVALGYKDPTGHESKVADAVRAAANATRPPPSVGKIADNAARDMATILLIEGKIRDNAIMPLGSDRTSKPGPRVLSRPGPVVQGIQTTKYKESDHQGTDEVASDGTPLKAIGRGTVLSAEDEGKPNGIVLRIQHPGGYISEYKHIKESMYEEGDQVEPDDVVATTGSTGGVKPHSHYGLWKDGKLVNLELHGSDYPTMDAARKAAAEKNAAEATRIEKLLKK